VLAAQVEHLQLKVLLAMIQFLAALPLVVAVVVEPILQTILLQQVTTAVPAAVAHQ
jgi:hypothetical protein